MKYCGYLGLGIGFVLVGECMGKLLGFVDRIGVVRAWN